MYGHHHFTPPSLGHSCHHSGPSHHNQTVLVGTEFLSPATLMYSQPPELSLQERENTRIESLLARINDNSLYQTDLNLKAFQWEKPDIHRFLTALKSNTYIKTVALKGVITRNDVKLLNEIIKRKQIKKLDLSEAIIPDKCINEILDVLQENQHLTHLNLGDNFFKSMDRWQEFFKHNSTVIKLQRTGRSINGLTIYLKRNKELNQIVDLYQSDIRPMGVIQQKILNMKAKGWVETIPLLYKRMPNLDYFMNDRTQPLSYYDIWLCYKQTLDKQSMATDQLFHIFLTLTPRFTQEPVLQLFVIYLATKVKHVHYTKVNDTQFISHDTFVDILKSKLLSLKSSGQSSSEKGKSAEVPSLELELQDLIKTHDEQVIKASLSKKEIKTIFNEHFGESNISLIELKIMSCISFYKKNNLINFHNFEKYFLDYMEIIIFKLDLHQNLGDRAPHLTKEFLLASLNNFFDNPAHRLQLLEELSNTIDNSNQTNHSLYERASAFRFSGVFFKMRKEMTPTKSKHLSALKAAYYTLVEQYKNNPYILHIAKTSSLVDTNVTEYEILTKEITKTRKKINSIIDNSDFVYELDICRNNYD